MDIQKESRVNNQSKSGSADKGSNIPGSKSSSISRSGSNNSNSVSTTSSSKSSTSKSRSESDNSGSRSSSSNSESSKTSGSESGNSKSTSSSSSRSRSASASSRSSGEGNNESKPIPIEEEVKPKVEVEIKLIEEEITPFDDKPFDDKPFDDKPFDDKPFDDKPFDDKPFDDKPFEDKPFEEVVKSKEEEIERKSSISSRSGSGSNSQSSRSESESGSTSRSSSSESSSRSESSSSRSSGEEEVKPIENDKIKPKEEVEVIKEEIKPIEKADIKPKEENETKPAEVEIKPKEEESQLDKKIIDKYMNILNILHNNYEKDINGLKMKIEDKTLIDYLTLIIKSNMIYSSYTDKINTIINKVTIVGSHININFIDEEMKSINKLKSEEEVVQSVENVKNHYLCLKDCHDLFIQLIESLLKDIDCTKQLGDLKLIENTVTQWNNRNNNEYISIENYYDYIFKFMEYLSKIYLAEIPPPPIPNLDYDEYCFQENEFVNVYHYQSKQYRLARIYSISNGIYTVKYLSESVLKFKANLLYPVLKPHDNVIFHLPTDSTPYDGMVVSNIHNNNYWILAKNRRRYYVPIDHLSTDRHYEIGSEVKVFYQDKYSNGVIISIEYDMRETYFMIRLYEENEDLLPDRLEKCKTILKINDN